MTAVDGPFRPSEAPRVVAARFATAVRAGDDQAARACCTDWPYSARQAHGDHPQRLFERARHPRRGALLKVGAVQRAGDEGARAAVAVQLCYQATQATRAGQPTAADPGPGESRAPALVQRMSDEGVAHRHVLAYLLEQAARGAVADFTEAFDVPEVGAAVVRGTLRPTPGSPAEAGQGAAMPEPIVLRVDRRDAGALFHAAHARVLTASLLVGG